PDHAFQDPRVTSYVNDGRAFLEQTTRRYDLILFALPDSLTLVAGQSSLRLESYLFTAEAMQAARAHLTPDGAFAEYNYYREQWLVDRLAGTLQQVYGHPPCLDSTGQVGRLALLMASPNEAVLQCPTLWRPAAATPAPATDDYPFLYLQQRTIPSFYLLTLALILAAGLLPALAVAWLVPPDLLLGLTVVPRFIVAIVLAFAPVFLANLLFASRFRDVAASNLAFATNLLGAMLGGVLEYASLVTGYRALLIVIALLYAGAFMLQRSQARRLARSG